MGDSVYPAPKPAAGVVADVLGISQEQAVSVLRALVRAGYVVAPRVPTDPMLSAYMACLNSPPSNHRTVLTNITKARKRWAAMGLAGTKVALSHRFLANSKAP